ncbi:hypothetical protein HKCCD6035_02400 [Rhodobacterales bacterium HKCCD6035]|nr:hypothetical protein [Rhodobacterales bacterium HKCCD6035]
MATKLQIAANRRNAVASTGPKTHYGKQKSAINGVKHGLNQPPRAEQVLEYLKPLLADYDIDVALCHDTDLGRALLAIATAEAQIDRVLLVIANAPDHEDERKRSHFWTETMLMFPRRDQYDAIMRQAVKLIEWCERNRIKKTYSNPKTLNRYLDAAINARRKAIKRLHTILPNFSETKPTSP